MEVLRTSQCRTAYRTARSFLRSARMDSFGSVRRTWVWKWKVNGKSTSLPSLPPNKYGHSNWGKSVNWGWKGGTLFWWVNSYGTTGMGDGHPQRPAFLRSHTRIPEFLITSMSHSPLLDEKQWVTLPISPNSWQAIGKWWNWNDEDTNRLPLANWPCCFFKKDIQKLFGVYVKTMPHIFR